MSFLAEIGQFSLVSALVVASISPIGVVLLRNEPSQLLAKFTVHASWLQFILVAAAYCLLTLSFWRDDFSLLYVASNSNSYLPWYYKISAVWGGHEGSLLLWVLILTGWALAVAKCTVLLPRRFIAYTLSVISAVLAGFLLLILLTSNPFNRAAVLSLDGRDLNPLLQDFGLIFHPPLLYIGYVGFVVIFAFAVSALLIGKLDRLWAQWARPWVLLPWIFLTLGIALGSWWAYNELGWGGWWFWDPVENASFMPWLAATALLHSLAVNEVRDTFKSWTLFLALLVFSLSLIGTFLVRSGVLVSIHAFASDPQRGIFLLAFFSIVIGASLVLYVLRSERIANVVSFSLWSRENFLLINNVILVVVMFSILTATLYPLALDAFGFGKISVGKPYFEAVFVPLMLPLVILAGIGPGIPWRQSGIRAQMVQLFPVLILSVLICGAILILLHRVDIGNISLLTAAGIFASSWITVAVGRLLWKRLRAIQLQKRSWSTAFTKVPRAYYGMSIAHLGLGIFVLGVTLTSAFSSQKIQEILAGESIDFIGYHLTLHSVRTVKGANYQSEMGRVDVWQDGQLTAQLYPERRIYLEQKSPMTEAAVDTTILRDLYVSISKADLPDHWIVRVYYRPMILWIWLGALCMALGALVAISGRRQTLGSGYS